MKLYVTGLAAFLFVVPIARGSDTDPGFPNDGLWEWLMEPTEVKVELGPPSEGDTSEKSVTVFFCEVTNLKLTPRVLNVQDVLPLVVAGNSGGYNLRVVAFDEAKQRLNIDGWSSCSNPDAKMQMTQVRLGEKRLKYLGVERLSPERQRFHAKEAQDKLLTEGITLVYPVEGETFSYQFGSTDKPIVTSDRHKGQVVLLQWWASW